MKIIFKLMFLVMALFIAYITEEAIRLRVEPSSIPMILTDRTKYCVECIKPGESLVVEYKSIGYKTRIEYYLPEDSSLDNKHIQLKQKEFLLFNKIRIWAWIE